MVKFFQQCNPYVTLTLHLTGIDTDQGEIPWMLLS